MTELLDEAQSKTKLFLFTPFALTKTSEVSNGVIMSSKNLKNNELEGLSEEEKPKVTDQLSYIAMTLYALLFANLAADRHNGVDPW